MLRKTVQYLKNKLNLFDKYISIDGWLHPLEAKGLFEVARLIGENSTVVEIGSWKGKSTWCIAQGLKSGKLHCIDPFNAEGEAGNKEIYEQQKGDINLLQQFKTNMKGHPHGVEIIIHEGYSNQFVGVVKEIDFLFIDGDHSVEGCRFDFEHFERNLKSGGYIAFHDYYPERPDLGPTWVIDNLIKGNPSYTHYNDFTSLSVYKKV